MEKIQTGTRRFQKTVLANEPNKVLKLSTGKGVCQEAKKTPRLTTGRQ